LGTVDISDESVRKRLWQPVGYVLRLLTPNRIEQGKRAVKIARSA